MSIPNYKNDEDFDEAFKNLLLPIESITKTNECENQYDLLKVILSINNTKKTKLYLYLFQKLDSYLNYLKMSSNESSSVFVEAALIIQNVTYIYHKKVDQMANEIMKFVEIFQS